MIKLRNPKRQIRNQLDNQDDLNQLTIDELNIELEKALKIEDYARAALLRDEIKTRK